MPCLGDLSRRLVDTMHSHESSHNLHSSWKSLQETASLCLRRIRPCRTCLWRMQKGSMGDGDRRTFKGHARVLWESDWASKQWPAINRQLIAETSYDSRN